MSWMATMVHEGYPVWMGGDGLMWGDGSVLWSAQVLGTAAGTQNAVLCIDIPMSHSAAGHCKVVPDTQQQMGRDNLERCRD